MADPIADEAIAAYRERGAGIPGSFAVVHGDPRQAGLAKDVPVGITDIRRKFSLSEMASGDVIFSATGVARGSMLEGVHFRGDFAETESLVMRSATGTVRRIKTTFRNVKMKMAGI